MCTWLKLAHTPGSASKNSSSEGAQGGGDRRAGDSERRETRMLSRVKAIPNREPRDAKESLCP
jgi:hypothetical protein